MTERLIKLLLTILTFGTILLSCSSNEKEDGQNTNDAETRKVVDKDPEELFAIIQEGVDPPSEALVEKFAELLNSIKIGYSNIPIKEIANKLAKGYKLAEEQGNKETLLQFVSGFEVGVQNKLRSNSSYDFSELIASYICFKTNCGAVVDNNITKLFSPDYVPPSTKSNYEGQSFVLIDKIETFKQRFNSSLKELKSSLRIQQVKIHGEPNDPGKAFEYSFSSSFSVIGALNKKDNSINSVSVIIENSNSLSEVANFVAAIIGVIASTNPSLTSTDRGEILREVGLTDVQNIDMTEPWTGKTIRNGVAYNFSVIPGQAVLFNAGQPEN